MLVCLHFTEITQTVNCQTEKVGTKFQTDYFPFMFFTQVLHPMTFYYKTELKESLTRMGADIKARVIDSVKRTWKTINDFALAHRTTPQQVMEQEVDSVISEMTKEEEDKIETGC